MKSIGVLCILICREVGNICVSYRFIKLIQLNLMFTVRFVFNRPSLKISRVRSRYEAYFTICCYLQFEVIDRCVQISFAKNAKIDKKNLIVFKIVDNDSNYSLKMSFESNNFCSMVLKNFFILQIEK